MDDLHALGITAVRMSNFFKTAPDGAVIDYLSPNPSYGSVVEFENVMDVLVKKGEISWMCVNMILSRTP